MKLRRMNYKFPIIHSKVNSLSADFQKNIENWRPILAKHQVAMQQSLFQGEEKYLVRAKKAGKLSARERIELLLDIDSPFLELMPLAGYGQSGVAVGASTVAGIGLVCGKECLIVANVGTIKGGAIDEYALLKALRCNEIALENRLPSIYLVESAGANLPDQAKIFNYGGINFREITRRSKLGIPTLSVVFGNSTAGGAYIPGMSDYVVMVKNKAKVFLAGPPLVKMATGEESDDESLGGADMHSRISGVSDYLAQDELDGIRLAREIMACIPYEKQGLSPILPVEEPFFSAEELLGIIPTDIKIPFDIREVIARIVDGSRFSEFKANYGNTMVCGYAYVLGYPVGILANNGIIFSESANKASQFIQLCNRSNIPLLYLQNITGFMVGRSYEETGIIKNGAKLINAVANSTVPSITVIVGASYGAGNYGMNGRSYQPRFLYALPHSKIAVMGPEQLAGVMEIIQREAAIKTGIPFNEENAKMMKMMISSQIDTESDAYYASSRVWDDGIIDPRQMRYIIGMSLSATCTSPVTGTKEFGVFRM